MRHSGLEAWPACKQHTLLPFVETVTSWCCTCRLYGCYQNIEGGWVYEAMEDFTGGLMETFNLTLDLLPDIFRIMSKAIERQSMIGCSTNVRPISQSINQSIYLDKAGYQRDNDHQAGRARRKPQRGQGNHNRGALSPPYSVCAEIETPKVWGGMSPTVRL